MTTVLRDVLIVLFSVSLGIPGPVWNGEQDANKAPAVMAKCRETLGLAKLKTLEISGNYRQVLGERELNGEIVINAMMPDKFMKVVTSSLVPGMEMTQTHTLNGAAVWDDNHTSAPAGMNFVFRSGPKGNSPDAAKLQQAFTRQELTRIMLGFFAAGPEAAKLEYSYGGEAEAPEGIADIIKIKGEDGFAAQLFIDQKSHLPLIVSYQGRKPRIITMTRTAAPTKKTPEEMEKDAQEAMEKAKAEPMVEIQMQFQDFKSEGGILLPHRISRTIDGQVNEEWELKKFKVNPSLKPEIFEKK